MEHRPEASTAREDPAAQQKDDERLGGASLFECPVLEEGDRNDDYPQQAPDNSTHKPAQSPDDNSPPKGVEGNSAKGLRRDLGACSTLSPHLPPASGACQRIPPGNGATGRGNSEPVLFGSPGRPAAGICRPAFSLTRHVDMRT